MIRLRAAGRERGLGGIVLCLTLVVGWSAIVAGQPGRVDISSPAIGPDDLAPVDQEYYDAVEPRLRALSTETLALLELGRSQSRDAGALLEGQRRVQLLIRDINLYRDERGVPDRFALSDAAYLAGREDAAESIRQARAALVRFDWDALGASVEQMARAAAAFRAADRAMIDPATSPSTETASVAVTDTETAVPGRWPFRGADWAAPPQRVNGHGREAML